MDVQSHNRAAWDRWVAAGKPYTIPVDAAAVKAARAGQPRIMLTPTRPVPPDWLGALAGRRVLCLASGGGQQGPLLAAAGAAVTVLDNSPRQLEQDRQVAAREALTIETVLGDMANLEALPDGRFDLIVHPVSNAFVPDVRPVWREAHRVLRPGGALLSGFGNPVVYVFDEEAYGQGQFIARHRLPHSDAATLSEAQHRQRLADGVPLEFGHTLEDQIGGQLDAGFVITGFYEDREPESRKDLLSAFMATYIATRAVRPA